MAEHSWEDHHDIDWTHANISHKEEHWYKIKSMTAYINTNQNIVSEPKVLVHNVWKSLIPQWIIWHYVILTTGSDNDDPIGIGHSPVTAFYINNLCRYTKETLCTLNVFNTIPSRVNSGIHSNVINKVPIGQHWLMMNRISLTKKTDYK